MELPAGGTRRPAGPLRIAYVSADRGHPVFGRSRVAARAQALLRTLRTLGHAVEVFTPRPGRDRPAGLADLPVHALPAGRPGRRWPPVWRALAINGEVRTALDAAGPFDLVYERYSLWSYAAMDWAAGAAIPSILEVDAPLVEVEGRRLGVLEAHAGVRVAHRAFGAAGVLAASAPAVAAYLRSLRVPAGRVRLAPHAIEPGRFLPEVGPAWSAPPGSFTIGYAGPLGEGEALPVLLRAFASLARFHDDCQLLLVGDGPERERLETLLGEWGLADRAWFAGAVPTCEVPSWLAAMDAVVTPPSTPAEWGWPLEVYEAMASARPVVARQSGPGRCLVEHELTGFTVPADDAWALATALSRLRRDYGLRCRLGANARAAVVRHHAWAESARALLDLARVGAASRAPLPAGRGWPQ